MLAFIRIAKDGQYLGVDLGKFHQTQSWLTGWYGTSHPSLALKQSLRNERRAHSCICELRGECEKASCEETAFFGFRDSSPFWCQVWLGAIWRGGCQQESFWVNGMREAQDESSRSSILWNILQYFTIFLWHFRWFPSGPWVFSCTGGLRNFTPWMSSKATDGTWWITSGLWYQEAFSRLGMRSFSWWFLKDDGKMVAKLPHVLRVRWKRPQKAPEMWTYQDEACRRLNIFQKSSEPSTSNYWRFEWFGIFKAVFVEPRHLRRKSVVNVSKISIDFMIQSRSHFLFPFSRIRCGSWWVLAFHAGERFGAELSETAFGCATLSQLLSSEFVQEEFVLRDATWLKNTRHCLFPVDRWSVTPYSSKGSLPTHVRLLDLSQILPTFCALPFLFPLLCSNLLSTHSPRFEMKNTAVPGHWHEKCLSSLS